MTIKKMIKSWEKKTIRDLEQVFIKQDHDFFISFLFVVVKDNLAEIKIILLISYLAYYLINSILSLGKKIESIWKVQVCRYWQNIAQYRKVTSLKAALPTYWTISPCFSHNKVWCCIWMGSSWKS